MPREKSMVDVGEATGVSLDDASSSDEVDIRKPMTLAKGTKQAKKRLTPLNIVLDQTLYLEPIGEHIAVNTTVWLVKNV